ncbi:PIG-L deacetylase family protein [Aliarcobacter butzleri]|uniref:PIG-L deacetylase family protein n=1 Tax=Aliarcobacter butzleri TaxID=28197 RepID=UPI000DB36BA5|nr:PIG-L deacetylase family protein [Aliarcobacter butzleri]MDN5062005.1 PIG-L family deacetylase [Aliarcobacter butzleri]PZQ05887.1 MAG: GlcNAc-PI de-N-acetylase [Aliarcobacter butzleri]
MNKILVVAVHPDDETLGCGGTLLKYKDNGDEINWLICTELPKTNKLFQKREEEIQKVASMYKFDSVHKLNLETTKVDQYSMNDIIGKLSTIINEIKPDIVFLPFKNDVHSDHRKIFDASYSCTKSFRYPFIKKIYMMETLSETEFAISLASESFIPNVFNDISNYFNKKIEIMKTYESELAEHPFPRSLDNIEALARFRGATSNCKYAESFMLLKEIF